MRHRRRDNEDSPAEHRRGPPPRKASQPDTPRHPWAPTLLVRPRSGERRRCYWRNWPEKCTKAPKPAQAQTILKSSLPDPASSPSRGGNYRIRRCSDCGGNEQFEPVVPRLCQMVGREAFSFLSNYPRSTSSFPVLSSSLANRLAKNPVNRQARDDDVLSEFHRRYSFGVARSSVRAPECASVRCFVGTVSGPG